MLTRYYDQNGKVLDYKEAKFNSEKRWEKLFSSIDDTPEIEWSNNIFSVESYIKSKQKAQAKNRKRNQVINSKTMKKEHKMNFEIPDFVIESNNEEVVNEKTNAKPIISSVEHENKLKVVTDELIEMETDKKIYKLQIGVADFAKKVKDNEGMGISTFSSDDEKESNESSQNIKLKKKTRESDRPLLSAIRTEHFMKMYLIATEKRKKLSKKQFTPMEKFLHGVRLTMLLVKTCRTSTQQTERNNKKFLTFADYQESEEENKISGMFDITIFKARKESTLSSDAIEIMRINPKLRSQELLHVALVALNSTVEAFSEFPLSMQTSLIKRGWYEKFESKRIIIRQGHAALNFYFMISGITTVSVARTNKTTGETYSETVAFLKKGNSFGELALMFGGKRSATVSCKTDVELLAVSREDFIDIFMSVSGKGEPEHITFLRQISLLNQWPIDEIPFDDPSICLFTYFRRGTVLCHDSNSGSWVYIVKSGTCRVIKLIQLSPEEQRDQLKVFKENNKYYSFLTQDSLRGSIKNYKHEIPPPEIKPAKVFNGKYYVQLKILNAGSTFGLEPMAFEFVGGTTSVTLVSDGAELVAIEKNFFQKNMTRQYQSWLRKELQPFPPIENLKGKLKNFYHWADYKESITRAIVFDKLSY